MEYKISKREKDKLYTIVEDLYDKLDNRYCSEQEENVKELQLLEFYARLASEAFAIINNSFQPIEHKQ